MNILTLLTEIYCSLSSDTLFFSLIHTNLPAAFKPAMHHSPSACTACPRCYEYLRHPSPTAPCSHLLSSPPSPLLSFLSSPLLLSSLSPPSPLLSSLLPPLSPTRCRVLTPHLSQPLAVSQRSSYRALITTHTHTHTHTLVNRYRSPPDGAFHYPSMSRD